MMASSSLGSIMVLVLASIVGAQCSYEGAHANNPDVIGATGRREAPDAAMLTTSDPQPFRHDVHHDLPLSASGPDVKPATTREVLADMARSQPGQQQQQQQQQQQHKLLHLKLITAVLMSKQGPENAQPAAEACHSDVPLDASTRSTADAGSDASSCAASPTHSVTHGSSAMTTTPGKCSDNSIISSRSRQSCARAFGSRLGRHDAAAADEVWMNGVEASAPSRRNTPAAATQRLHQPRKQLPLRAVRGPSQLLEDLKWRDSMHGRRTALHNGDARLRMPPPPELAAPGIGPDRRGSSRGVAMQPASCHDLVVWGVEQLIWPFAPLTPYHAPAYLHCLPQPECPEQGGSRPASAPSSTATVGCAAEPPDLGSDGRSIGGAADPPPGGGSEAWGPPSGAAEHLFGTSELTAGRAHEGRHLAQVCLLSTAAVNGLQCVSYAVM